MKHQREDYNERIKCVDGSIPDDEPVFLLRGKDPTAASCLRHWISLNQHRDKDKLEAIEKHAEWMEGYAETIKTK